MGVWVLVEDDDGVAQDASLTLEFWAKWHSTPKFAKQINNKNAIDIKAQLNAI